jgi:hypothetical protein
MAGEESDAFSVAAEVASHRLGLVAAACGYVDRSGWFHFCADGSFRAGVCFDLVGIARGHRGPSVLFGLDGGCRPVRSEVLTYQFWPA